ncbi:ankyrin-3-like [Sabethes cyaneus]|uniref:ankyrin-3-like n=1 Tax=Sabethes cyaneus TaxID=53552 RepID=UPI00237D7B39|nr:ankyrin-3-like [Sabethes cyaneus]
MRLVQQESFRELHEDLKKGKRKLKQHRSLASFIDTDGLIRVGGRPKYSSIPYDGKHQILLPEKHHVTQILVRQLHNDYFHVGQQGLLSIVRERYWPINARVLIKRIVSKCYVCFRYNPPPTDQFMDIYDQLLCSDERDEQISNERLISRIQGRIESCMHLKDYDSVARDCYHLIMLLEDTRSMSNPDYSCSKDVTSDDVASYKIYLRLLYVLYEQHKYMEAYDILQKLPTNLNNYADTKPRVEDLTRLLEMNLENDQTKLSKIASTTTYTQFKSILAELENLSISDNNSIPNSLDIVRNQLKDPIDTDCSFYNIIRSNDIEQLDKYYVKCTENKIAPNDLEEMLSQDYEDLKLKNVPLSKDMEIFVEEKLINHRFFTNQSQFNKNATDFKSRNIAMWTALHFAAKGHSLETIRFVMEHGVDLEAKDVDGRTALHVAAEHGNREIVIFLIERNRSHVNVRNARGKTALHLAVHNGHKDIVEVLLDNDADLAIRDNGDLTPLYSAIINNHVEIAKLLFRNTEPGNMKDGVLEYGHKEIVAVLLKNGAFIDVPETIEERSPLYAAAQFGHIEITKMLLDNGANIYSRTSVGATPLHSAAHSGHSQIVEELIKRGAEIDSKTKYRLTPLHVAAEKGKNIVVGILIANKADTGIKSSTGTTPLHAAAQYGSIETMEILLTNEADVNAKDFDERTPLMLAAYNGHTEAVAFLIKHGASTDANSINCMTALHAAILGTHKDIVNLLISHGARVNVKSVDNFTPLLAAIQSGNEEIVGMLLAKGANINEKIEGITPMQFAIRHNHKRIVEILLEKGIHIRKDHEPLFGAVCLGHNDIVELLLKNKAHVDAKHPKENVTPLHLAATVGRPDTVKILLQHGASVDGLRGASCTPLYSAAEMGHSKVVEILIASGANVNVRNIDGPPLHIAAGKGHMKVVEILLNNGANADSKDNHGRTALELAASHGYLSIVKCLMQYKHFNLNDRGNDGFTVLHIASQEGKLETVKYLVNSGSDMYATNNFGSKPVHVAAREGYKDVVEFFIEQGMDINEPGNNNQTILHYSILNNNVAIAQYLIQKGANINAKDTCGLTPVHLKKLNEALAGWQKCFDKMKYTFGSTHSSVLDMQMKMEKIDKIRQMQIDPHILNNVLTNQQMILDKSDVNVKDKFGRTALHYAVSKHDVTAVSDLLKGGADVTLATDKGNTPLHTAANTGSEKITDMLLRTVSSEQLSAFINAQTTAAGTTSLHIAAKNGFEGVTRTLLKRGAIYNPKNNERKTPLDLCNDQEIRNLLQLTAEVFDKVCKGQMEIIHNLQSMDQADVEIITCARNDKGHTILQTALGYFFIEFKDLLT